MAVMPPHTPARLARAVLATLVALTLLPAAAQAKIIELG
jgi:hypothetical protein